MAFLAPAAAGAVGTAAAGTAATTALGAGLSAGTALGAGVGLKATGALLAPTLGAGLGATGAGLGAAGLGGLGLGGLGLKAGAGALLPGLASAGGAGLGGLGAAGLGGVGFKGAGAMLAPKLGASLPASALATPGFKSLAMANAPLTAPSSFSAVNQAVGLGDIGAKTTTLTPELTKASYLTQGAGPSVPSLEVRQLADLSSGVTKGGLKMPTPGAETTGLRLSPEAAQSVMTPRGSPIIKGDNFLSNFGNLIQNPSLDAAGDYIKEHPGASMAAGYGLLSAMQSKPKQPEVDKGMIRPYKFAYNPNAEAYAVSPTADSSEQLYFSPVFTPEEPVKAKEGGIMALAVGGPVETMSAMNAIGGNMMYPQATLQTPMYSNPLVQRPEAVNIISPSAEPAVGAYSGEQKFAEGGEPKTEGQYKYDFDPKTNTFTQVGVPKYADTTGKKAPALYTGAKTVGGINPPVGGPGIAALMPQAQPAYTGPVIPAYQTPEERLGLTEFYPMAYDRLAAQRGYAAGGDVYDLGGYSDGGRLLRGPGDGVSDSIPAVIGKRQPARLADGEFVIPARIVSELGNGSTEAGARKLYAMMDRVQKARGKTVGKKKVAVNTKADKHLPA